ncbi:MAG TPA: DUF5671 domain-containing protein [Acidimicrobiia bacterium]|nr:DUF5671 domain-containing protein [Acidimicrobiia bacterium]
MAFTSLFLLAGLLVFVVLVVVVIQRIMKKSDQRSDGSDLVSYLILAIAMGFTGFALARLARTAFPGDQFIFDPAEQVATSLAALVVSTPFVVYFWRRQADRRVAYPTSSGWTLYLALMELVFMTAFVVVTTILLDGLFTGEGFGDWVSPIVFGAIVLFHEFAARRTPPRSDAADLYRVIGSAIGLISLTIGLTGTLSGVFSLPFDNLSGEFNPWLAMAVVGTPVWVYRWFSRTDPSPGLPRTVWTVLVAVGSLTAAVGSGTALVVLASQYVIGERSPGGQHFESATWLLAMFVVTFAVWFAHRKELGPQRDNALRAYEYGAAAIGLAATLVGAIGLTILAFDEPALVGGGSNDVIATTGVLVGGLVSWLVLSRRHVAGDSATEKTAWPRRLYNLGLGVITALVAAGSLVTALFVLFRRVMGGDETASALVPVTVTVFTGLAAWYLLTAYARERTTATDGQIVVPFEVVVMCSHPGPLAATFPEQARLRVIHRGDDLGVVDQEMASEIVATVANQPSLVWVDGDGFRVAPKFTD